MADFDPSALPIPTGLTPKAGAANSSPFALAEAQDDDEDLLDVDALLDGLTDAPHGLY